MSRVAVLLNGIPGAGKTTLAEPLGRELSIPVVRKDAIKEGLADVIPARLPTRSLGALSVETMWAIVGMLDEPVLVECFWATGRDEGFLTEGLRVGGVEVGIEIWCTVATELARERVVTRARHHAHQDGERSLEGWDELTRSARPISRFPVIEVDTSGPVDVPALAAEIRSRLPDLG